MDKTDLSQDNGAIPFCNNMIYSTLANEINS